MKTWAKWTCLVAALAVGGCAMVDRTATSADPEMLLDKEGNLVINGGTMEVTGGTLWEYQCTPDIEAQKT